MQMSESYFVPEVIHLEHTLENGQCFRWRKISEGHYLGVVHGMVLEAKQMEEGTLLTPMDEELFQRVFYDYFGFGRDLLRRQDALAQKDPWLKIAVDYCRGLSILKQDPWETLITFILSQNNHIPRIRSLVEKLAVLRGPKLTYRGNQLPDRQEEFYGFPTPSELENVTEEELRTLGFGYRAGYVVDAVQKVLAGEVDLEKVVGLPLHGGREELKRIKGVGNKVADCVLLFGYGFQEAFPVDVWVLRALERFYCKEIEEAGSREAFIKEYFGGEGGLAQQMLFHTLRNGMYP